jgi:pSer/pThr/pTyr-binding forkhead associated (FHA) protein
MLLLRVTDSRGTVTQHIAGSFPYRIGRSAQDDLRLEAPGVWENHATIFPAANARFLVRPGGESLLFRNGEPIGEAQLAPGDELSIGSVRVLVSLAPAIQTRLGFAEATVWALLCAVIAAEVAVFLFAR